MASIMEVCPRCGVAYSLRSGGSGSGLGSRKFACARCEDSFDSGRDEWETMGTAGKLWYCLASLVYAVVIGFFGGWVVAGVRLFLTEGPTSRNVTYDGLVWVSTILAAALVALLQLSRVWLSIRRSMRLDDRRLIASFWLSWQTNLQFLVLMALITPLLLAWLASWLIHRNP